MSLGTKNRQRRNADLCKEYLRREHAAQAALVEEFIREIEGPEEEPNLAAWAQFTDTKRSDAEMLERVGVKFQEWLGPL